MTGLTKAQQKKIHKLAKEGKTQGQIAKAIHKQKLPVSKYMQAQGLGTRKVSGSTLFWRDVKSTKELLQIPHKEATEIIFKSSKWKEKRFNRLSELNRMAAEKWADLDRKARAIRMREFKRGDFRDNVGVSPEDYENYFETEY